MGAVFSPHQVKVDPNNESAGLGCLAGIVLTCFFAMVLGATAASAQERNSYLRRVTIEASGERGSINCFGCSVVVKGDLDGEIVTIGGDVTVHGRVRRDIVAVGGTIRLKNGAEIDEDAVAIGGGITTEGAILAPKREGFVALPWMHFPGQLSIGWRGAVSLLAFHAVCIILPLATLRPRRVRNVAVASRRWLVTGLLGAGFTVALSYLLGWIDDHVRSGDTISAILGTLFLAIFAMGVAGISVAIGERIFQGRVIAAIFAGGILLVILELTPYLGFVVMILAGSWASGAALWSGMGFRGTPAAKDAQTPAVHRQIS
jgi:hypothetical protein